MRWQGPKPTGVLDVLLPVSGMDRRHLFGTLKELRRLNMWPQARLTGKPEHEPVDESHCVRLILALLGAEKFVDIEEAVTALLTLPLIRLADIPKGKLRLVPVKTGDPLGLLLIRELCGVRRGENQRIASVNVTQGPKWVTFVQYHSKDPPWPMAVFANEGEPHLLFERTRSIDGKIFNMLAEFLGLIKD